ncbi:MAG: sodium:calcium antiporter [Pyrinomonadaceae bacterium]
MEFFNSFEAQLTIFAVSAVAIWYFCRKLSDVVEFVDAEFGLGSAFGGTLILAIVTNLPETSIAITGAIKGNYSLIAGNLLGGIAMQNLLLILYDFYSKDTRPLSTITSSKAGIFQGVALILILLLCLFGSLPNSASTSLIAGIPSWLIVIIWLSSLLLLKHLNTAKRRRKTKIPGSYTRKSSLVWLGAISIVVFVFGVLLENSSDAIATRFGLSGVFFGATVLAFVTSLPEISSGLEFVRNKEYKPIISDIFGGNGFLPVLFLPASLIAGRNILSGAGEANRLISILSIALTVTFIIGMVLKVPKKFGRLGWDTWLMLLIGAIGFGVLFYVS